ncbi:MAG: hypothetical protein COT24_01310 [Candidatus Kerfeldbacteria bacterium CG08_land_8_20_14_0_20_40_16]|uniref:TrpR like protein, YerC/YecD n=1 Tax=Candidatus Kerfeldbacteria bacterium CG08_land_8_20_14_0_20_40_16 TaxID=2014244 RepID=A0A2H0YYN7_9BACT|nr:MAG: hypothetical protein COT24_01310 [Candidatus Kerfeldbacteria bacterium CG08_land_8_20_14_0_20_40_16]
MSRYNEKKISYAHQEQLVDMFCEILCQLKSKQAIKNFLKDVLNRQERITLIRRLLIAEMLYGGSTYKEIAKRLHCGFPTIARVARWLHFGRGGYQKAIQLKKVK